MRRTFELAKRGEGKTSPNPLVGCLIVQGEKVIAEAYHHRFGGPHAERIALLKAGNKTRFSTLFVNLEPCAHWGKTPPCTDAILKGGIKRVVCAMVDPNPLVRGKGIHTLRQNGISVSTGLLENEAKNINRAFVKYITKKRPYVILKAAMTLDGKIATSTRQSKWITGPKTRGNARKFRGRVDAIMVGAETVRRDDPQLLAQKGDKNPIRIVVSKKLKFSIKSRVFNQEAQTIVLTPLKSKHPQVRKLINNGIEVISVPGSGKIFMINILNILTKMNVRQLLIEGGGSIAGAAMDAGIVDEIMFYYAPKILGGKEAITGIEGIGQKTINQAWTIQNMRIKRIGQDFLIQGRLKK